MPTVAEPEFDLDAIVDETIRYVSVRADGDGWVGETPDWFGERLFGGFVIAQALHAAAQVAPPGRRVHSLHAYFLRAMLAGPPVRYRIEPVREGRTLSLHHLVASQDGEPLLTMFCSFAGDGAGYEYELPMADDVPDPDRSTSEVGPGPWEVVRLGPTPPAGDGTMASTHRSWMRIARPLPDDDALHLAMLGFLSDTTGTGGRPLHLDGDVRGMISLDHAVWFHRSPRADEWLYYDVHSLVNTGGRGLLRGTVYDRERHVVASVAQEMILRPYESIPD